MEDTVKPNQVKPLSDSWPGRSLDFLFIFLLPLIYLAWDFIVGGLAWFYYPATLSTCVIAAMIAYTLSRFLRDSKFAQIVRGILIFSGIGYYLIGFVLLVTSLVAFAIFGIYGFISVLLSLVPIIAGHRLLVRAKATKPAANRSVRHLLVGATLTLFAASSVLTIEFVGDYFRYIDLVSDDRSRVLRALSSQSWYSPRDVFRHPAPQKYTICSELKIPYGNDKEIRNAVERALKISPNDTIIEYCDRYLYD